MNGFLQLCLAVLLPTSPILTDLAPTPTCPAAEISLGAEIARLSQAKKLVGQSDEGLTIALPGSQRMLSTPVAGFNALNALLALTRQRPLDGHALGRMLFEASYEYPRLLQQSMNLAILGKLLKGWSREVPELDVGIRYQLAHGFLHVTPQTLTPAGNELKIIKIQFPNEITTHALLVAGVDEAREALVVHDPSDNQLKRLRYKIYRTDTLGTVMVEYEEAANWCPILQVLHLAAAFKS